jgi:large subunit ribosomal protein L1
MKHGKKFRAAKEKAGAKPMYTLAEALEQIKATRFAQFDESVDMAFRLGVDPRKADQMVRGTVSLPNGTGKTVRVLVITKGEKVQEAEAAGADMVGADDYIEKIKGGWIDMDAVIATPDMMGQLGRLGKILGPRGLMPNPKTGTVTQDVAKAVKELKAGRIEYRVDKTGNIMASIGKCSFEDQALQENAEALADAVLRARPAAAKGTYLKNVSLSSSMGPGFKVDVAALQAGLKR